MDVTVNVVNVEPFILSSNVASMRRSDRYKRFSLKWVLVAGSLGVNNWEKEFIRKEIGTSSLSSDRQIRMSAPH